MTLKPLDLVAPDAPSSEPPVLRVLVEPSARTSEIEDLVAPHDPRDRDLVFQLGEWEVRVFKSRWFAFFASRGLWHVQLFHPERRVSILTPSKLTRDTYEVNPSPESRRASGGPIRAMTYRAIARVVEDDHRAIAPTEQEIAWIESVFVRRVVDGGGPGH